MKEILTGIADVLLPGRCPICHATVRTRQALPLCESCLSQITAIRPPICSACGLPFPTESGTDHLCGDCLLSPRVFTRARAVGHYEGSLLTAIHAFKYQGQSALGRILGRLMADHDYHDFHISSCTMIIPVPLHVRRLRERGFNQALILARAIARRHELPLDFTSLMRQVATPPQITLGKTERQRNVRDAFRIREPGRVKGEKIIIVDDVYTTGSTLNECARVLLEGGANEVAALTLARAI